MNRLWQLKQDRRPRRLRRSVQLLFLGICLWVGWRFGAFYHACLASGQPTVTRPAGVDAFLPISGLMSVRYWFQTGDIHSVHPAALLILAVIVGISFLFKRSFCSWVCPVGFLGEKLADLGGKFLRRSLKLPRWVDLPLRGLKYLILAFFLDMIFLRMDRDSLQAFLESPFNALADVRLLQFFLHPSSTTLVGLTVLAAASVFIRQFWCRYLCPYGALTALAGLISPTRIQRDIPSCIDCGKCARACPASLPVHRLTTVHSDECSLCLECVQHCPVANTLQVRVSGSKWRIRPVWMGAGIVLAFLLVIAGGKVTRHWESSVTGEQTATWIQMTSPERP